LSDVFTTYQHYQLKNTDFYNLQPVRISKSNFSKHITDDNRISSFSVRGESFSYKLSTELNFTTLWKDKNIEVVLTCNIRDVIWKQNNVVSNVSDFTKIDTSFFKHVAISESLWVMVATMTSSPTVYYSLDMWDTWTDTWTDIWAYACLVAWSEDLGYFISTPWDSVGSSAPVYKSLDWIVWTSLGTIPGSIQDKKSLKWVSIFNKFIVCWLPTSNGQKCFMSSTDGVSWAEITWSPSKDSTFLWYRDFTITNWKLYWVWLSRFCYTWDLTTWNEDFVANITSIPHSITDRTGGWLVAVWDSWNVFISEDYLTFTVSSIWNSANLYSIKHNQNWTLYIISWRNVDWVNYWIYKSNDLITFTDIWSVDLLDNNLAFNNYNVLFTIDNCFVFSQQWVLRMLSTVWDISFELEQTIFDIKIWDKINVRNIDLNNELSNLTVSRREFNWDNIIIYLNDYRQNFVEELKKIQGKIDWNRPGYWPYSWVIW